MQEETANVLTHALGVLLSVAGGTLLIVSAASQGDPWKIVTVTVFVASLVLLYSASTIYHTARDSDAKKKLKVFDHAAIYVLIAGTYTPFMLVGMRGPWGWSLFGVIWGLAVVGIFFKLYFTGRFPRLSTSIYIGMGWLILIGAVPLWRSVDSVALMWLVAGGVAYTAGTAFYHSHRRFSHAVWHLFVVTGSFCHGVAVALQL